MAGPPIGRAGRVDEVTARLSASPLFDWAVACRPSAGRRRDSPAFGELVRWRGLEGAPRFRLSAKPWLGRFAAEGLVS